MYRDPSTQDLNRPEFNALWEEIKEWDIKVRVGDGYAGASGNHVMAILDSIEDLMISNQGINLSIKCHGCGRTTHINRPITGSLRCVCRTYLVQICNDHDQYCNGGGS